MADSLAYPVKISCSREKRQKQEKSREANQEPSLSYLSSPARLHSTVPQTMAPRAHTATKRSNIRSSRPTGKIPQSTIIINTLKREIERSQEVLLGRITQLNDKCNAVL